MKKNRDVLFLAFSLMLLVPLFSGCRESVMSEDDKRSVAVFDEVLNSSSFDQAVECLGRLGDTNYIAILITELTGNRYEEYGGLIHGWKDRTFKSKRSGGGWSFRSVKLRLEGKPILDCQLLEKKTINYEVQIFIK